MGYSLVDERVEKQVEERIELMSQWESNSKIKLRSEWRSRKVCIGASKEANKMKKGMNHSNEKAVEKIF